MLVEIAVHHFTDKEKVNIIRQQGHAAIEIDANAILRTFQEKQSIFQSHQFRKHLLFSPKHKKWLFNPRQEQFEKDLLKKATVRNARRLSFGEKIYYLVRNCPKEKNIHQQAYKSDQFYANVFRDCLHCSSCIEIKYKKHFFALKEVNGTPESVICAPV